MDTGLLAQNNATPWITLTIVAFILVICLIPFLLAISIFRSWAQSFFSGGRVSFFDLVGMKFRKVDPKVIVSNHVMSIQAGHPVSVRELESAYLAGTDVTLTTRAFLVAKDKGKEFTFQELASIDRAETLMKMLSDS